KTSVRWTSSIAASAQSTTPSIRDAQSFSKSGTRRTAHLSNSTASHRRERIEKSFRSRLCEAVELLKCAVRRVPLFENDWASRIEGDAQSFSKSGTRRTAHLSNSTASHRRERIEKSFLALAAYPAKKLWYIPSILA